MTPVHAVSNPVDTIRQLLQLLLDQLTFLEWIIHPLLNVRIQVLVTQGTQGNLPIHAALLGRPNHTPRHDNADVPDTADVGIEPAIRVLLGIQRRRQGGRGGIDHILRHIDRLGEDGTEPDAREDVHVVALTGGQEAAVVREGGEGRAGGEEAAAVGVANGVLEGALGFRRRVREGEDDGGRVELGHALEDGRGEGAADGRQTHEDGGLHVLDDLLERLELLAVVVVAAEVDLVLGERVAAVVGDETARVDEPEAAPGFVFREAAFFDEVLDELLGDTDTGASGAQEDGALSGGRDLGCTAGVDKASEDDGPGALNVVVEHGVGVLIAFE